MGIERVGHAIDQPCLTKKEEENCSHVGVKHGRMDEGGVRLSPDNPDSKCWFSKVTLRRRPEVDVGESL